MGAAARSIPDATALSIRQSFSVSRDGTQLRIRGVPPAFRTPTDGDWVRRLMAIAMVAPGRRTAGLRLTFRFMTRARLAIATP
jgi:hypothetical protein